MGKINDSTKKLSGYGWGTMAWWAFLSMVLLIAAVWQAFQGDWAPAIFLAIIWHGIGNNSTANLIYRQLVMMRGYTF